MTPHEPCPHRTTCVCLRAPPFSSHESQRDFTENGELLARAEQMFAVFVTMDGNIEFQQSDVRLRLRLAIVALRAKSDRLRDTEPWRKKKKQQFCAEMIPVFLAFIAASVDELDSTVVEAR